MGVETAKIVVEGDTNGATEALQRTAKATDQVTTASAAAGAQLADLTKQTNAATKAQAESAAAINKLKQAADECTMTERAFGASSKEAADAQARLTRATEQAKIAEKALVVELEQAKAAVAATTAASDKASPALARQTREVEKLTAAADRNAHELKKQELAQMANARASAKGAGGFDLVGMAGSKLSGVLGPAALGATLMAVGSWLGDAAEKTLQYETALRNLPFGIQAAQEATHGLISAQSLAVSASAAVALGVVKTEAEYSRLASDASKIALKLGVSSEQMLGDLTTALGRGSAMILDNAGIILKVSDANEAYAKSVGKTVDQLDEAEKKLAFQTAAMRAIRESADQTSVAYDSGAAAISRFGVQAENAANSVGQLASNTAGAFLEMNEQAAQNELAYANLERNLEQNAAAMARWRDEEEEAKVSTIAWAASIVRTTDAFRDLSAFLSSDAAQAAAANGLETERKRLGILAQEADLAERQGKAFAKLLADQEAHLDAQAMASITYGPALPPKAEKRRAGKKAAEMVDPQTVALARIGDGRDESTGIASMAAFNERTAAAAAEAAGIQQNIEARQASIEAINLEMEAREAAGLASDDLIARRFENERQLLEYVRSTSTDKARIAEAETRWNKAQHDRRLRDLRATYAAEQKEQAKRQGHMQIMASAVEGFGNAVVSAMDAEAEGSKGAIAKSLQAWLTGVRNQMIVKGAMELAFVAASAASFNPAGVAMHGTAAGMAFAAAAAAGIAGVAIGAAVPADSGASAAGSSRGGGGGSVPSSGGGGSSSSREGNERQDVPVSYDETRHKSVDMPRNMQSAGASHTTVTHVHVTGLMVGDEGKLGAELNRLADKGKRHGKRN